MAPANPSSRMLNQQRPGAAGATGSSMGTSMGTPTSMSALTPTHDSLARKLAQWVVGSPGSAWAIIIVATLAALLAIVFIGMNRRVLVLPGQVMDHTRVTRVPVEILDQSTLRTEQDLARARAPKVLVGDSAYIEEVVRSIATLPRAVADAATLEAVAPQLRETFKLTEETLAAARAHGSVSRDGTADGVSESWTRRSAELAAILRTTPIVDSDTFQLQWSAGNAPPNTAGELATDRIELQLAGKPPMIVRGTELLNASSPRLPGQLRVLAVSAGFSGEELDLITSRLTYRPKPTFVFDRAATLARQEAASKAVQAKINRVGSGVLLYSRGERLSEQQLALVKAEVTAFRASAPGYQLLAGDAALFALAALLAMGVGAYIGTFAPKLVGQPRRLAVLALLVLSTLVLACAVAVIDPKLVVAAVAVPPVFVAAVLVVAYERRTALAVGSIAGIASGTALGQPIEVAILPIVGVALMVWQLREIRHRGTLVKAALMSGILLSGITLTLVVLRLPLVEAAIPQMLTDAASVGIGVLLVGLVVFAMLPTIERSFGVLTSLSLIELRDPSRPLLRNLQQRAPGTYSHSMNVATLAESACQAIGADSLLAYVGALYHDVGKMNRPDMFVENQTGVNRHDRLPPAMSLLMIVSHVADGLELAREFKLPAPLHHFIEAHHGTTVVEFFYHRARKQHEALCAQGKGETQEAPTEHEYRYPGPRPRTKEVAVMMICDAAEGAARSMTDPSAMKIEHLVRSIADKRLADGQFDECELTMKELSLIVETVSRTLAGIHHQRVAYPEPIGKSSIAPAQTGAIQTPQAGASPASTRAVGV